MIRQRQIDIEARKNHADTLQKYKNEIMIISKKLELSQRESEHIKKALGKAENDLLAMREKMKVSVTGQKNDKEDYRQTLLKMEQKVAQVSHELRKKEANFTKVQEQYRKTTKDSLPYKNGFDITYKVSAEGLEPLYKHIASCNSPPVHQFALLLKAGYEETQRRLVEENSRLKDCMKYLQDELVGMLNKSIERVKATLVGKEQSTKCLEPIHVKPIVFQMSVGHVLNDIYQIFRENICRIKDALDILITLSN